MTAGCCDRCGKPAPDLLRVDTHTDSPVLALIEWCGPCRGEGLVLVQRGRATVGVHYVPSKGSTRPRGT